VQTAYNARLPLLFVHAQYSFLYHYIFIHCHVIGLTAVLLQA